MSYEIIMSNKSTVSVPTLPYAFHKLINSEKLDDLDKRLLNFHLKNWGWKKDDHFQIRQDGKILYSMK